MIALALLCAAAGSSAGARSAASFVPARADAAVLLDGSQGAAGLRAFFDRVAQLAPALAAGPRMAALVGPDLLGQPLAWGLAASGPRAFVLASGSAGLTAPVRDAKAARAALQSWLAQSGPLRQVRVPALRSAMAAGDGPRTRAGALVPVGGALRLLTASGAQATAVLAMLAQAATRAAAPLSSDRVLAPALARLTGPAAVVARGADPLRAAVLSLDGSAQGLVARGLLVAREPLLAGAAPGPAACAGASLLCVRAALGPSGRQALALAAQAYLRALLPPAAREAPDRLAQQAAAAADRVVVRSDGADPRLLAGEREALWAVRLQGASAPPPAEGAAEASGPRSFCIRAGGTAAWFGTPCPAAAPADPSASGGASALEAQVDLRGIDAVLRKISPLDALQGGFAAALYAARLTLGGLLRASGPVTATGQPHPAGAEVELRWPLQ